MKMPHPQAITDVDEFVSSDVEKWEIICGEWVPSEWESKQLIKHHDIHK